MSDFDQKLKDLLSENDEALIEASLDGDGYWDELFASLKACLLYTSPSPRDQA